MRSAFANPLHVTQKFDTSFKYFSVDSAAYKAWHFGRPSPLNKEVLMVELKPPCKIKLQSYEFIPAFDYTTFLATSDHKLTPIVYELRRTVYIPAV